jgi:hypothetical protein
LEITHRTSGNVTVIDLDGKITLGEGELLSELHSLMKQGHQRILLNLANVPYLHSSGLGEVMRAREAVIGVCRRRHTRGQHAGEHGSGACAQHGCDCRGFHGSILKLLNPSKPIADLLRVSRLLNSSKPSMPEDSAVRSFPV